MIRRNWGLFDIKLIKFIGVGIVNTLVGIAIMFGLYNIVGCSYWFSSAANYIITSILSYVLNKRFTFSYRGDIKGSFFRFALTIAICYSIAYGAAKPFVYYILNGSSAKVRDNIAMALGMILFTCLNYLGQRLFAFARKGSSECDG